jgi:quercetin dioxygenase-like cupin family protein
MTALALVWIALVAGAGPSNGSQAPLQSLADGGVVEPRWPFPFSVKADSSKAFRRRGVGAQTRVLIDEASTGARRAALLEVTVTDEVQLEPHFHPRSAEWVVVLDGGVRLRGRAEGSWLDLEAGDAVFLPPRSVHGWQWAKKPHQKATLLIFYSPPGPNLAFFAEEGFRETVVLKPADFRALSPSPEAVVSRAGAGTEELIADGLGSLRLAFEGAEAALGRLNAWQGMSLAIAPNGSELLVYVLAGAGVLTVDGEHVALAPRTAVHIPPGKSHVLEGTSSRPLELIVLLVPGGPQAAYRMTPSRTYKILRDVSGN